MTDPAEDAVESFRRAYPPRPMQGTKEPHSQIGGPSDTFPPDMEDIKTRLARLEGGSDTLKWSVAVVSAAILGLGAILLVLQGFTISRVGQVETKFEAKLDALDNQMRALPDQINRNLLELNRTLSASITAAQNSRQQPTVIVLPPQAQAQQAPQ